ncbi:alpha and gamma adaptin binding protein p34-domain-containing protein [Chlamydoabsidia padenii]|nr:alpha and gamma adaptin binding protein p34-domain-containing protein [Chlamydoabsidia padenii]
MTTRNKILVTGYPGSGTLEVVKGIFQSSKQTIPTLTNDAKDGMIIPWVIDNKYYTAAVDFWVDEPLVDNLQETIDAYGQEENKVGQVVDAFIYVFTPDQPDSFEGIKRWLGFLNTCEPAIRLCIATAQKVDTTSFEDWCLEHQFDFVDMAKQEQDDDELTPMDKVGYDLVVDALHTNMWDGLTRKDGKSKQPDVFVATTTTTTNEQDEKDLMDEMDDIENMDDDEWMKEIEKLKLEQDDLDLPSKEEVGIMYDQLFGNIDQEDGLDKALQSLQAMRERGKDLPDEERRKMAAQVALSFAAQLGL